MNNYDKQAVKLGAVSKARAYNFNKGSVSSIHYFNGQGMEVGYYFPCMHLPELTIVNRVNPIDYPNAFLIK